MSIFHLVSVQQLRQPVPKFVALTIGCLSTSEATPLIGIANIIENVSAFWKYHFFMRPLSDIHLELKSHGVVNEELDRLHAHGRLPVNIVAVADGSESTANVPFLQVWAESDEWDWVTPMIIAGLKSAGEARFATGAVEARLVDGDTKATLLLESDTASVWSDTVLCDGAVSFAKDYHHKATLDSDLVVVKGVLQQALITDAHQDFCEPGLVVCKINQDILDLTNAFLDSLDIDRPKVAFKVPAKVFARWVAIGLSNQQCQAMVESFLAKSPDHRIIFTTEISDHRDLAGYSAEDFQTMTEIDSEVSNFRAIGGMLKDLSEYINPERTFGIYHALESLSYISQLELSVEIMCDDHKIMREVWVAPSELKVSCYPTRALYKPIRLQSTYHMIHNRSVERGKNRFNYRGEVTALESITDAKNNDLFKYNEMYWVYSAANDNYSLLPENRIKQITTLDCGWFTAKENGLEFEYKTNPEYKALIDLWLGQNSSDDEPSMSELFTFWVFNKSIGAILYMRDGVVTSNQDLADMRHTLQLYKDFRSKSEFEDTAPLYIPDANFEHITEDPHAFDNLCVAELNDASAPQP